MGLQQGRELANKWLKTQALLADPQIATHIPLTRLYVPGQLGGLIDRFGTVVLKPVRGTGGLGLMKAERIEGGYAFRHATMVRHVATLAEVRKLIDVYRRGRPYLIQQGIDLATVDGRPIDYRVKYVKNDAGAWEIRSMVGRIAARGLFVTNLCRGGRLVSGREGISRSLSPAVAGSKKREMRFLTKRSTALLERRFPGVRQLGYDYGIDRNGQIWMLEVNTRPH